MRILSYIFLFFSTIQAAAITPMEIVPDAAMGREIGGTFVRKGSVYATMQNSLLFDSLAKVPQSLEKNNKISKIAADIKNVIPGLQANGLFDFFTLNEWLSGESEGRILVALLYIESFPEKADKESIKRLYELNIKASEDLQPYVEEALAKFIKS